MTGSQARVVLVEDEPSVRGALEQALSGEGFTVSSFSDFTDPAEILATAPDLAVLDVILPSGDGFELAQRIRTRKDLPVIFLTARSSVQDRVAGFDLGADDYLVKPFAVEELLARVRAVLRRTGRLGATLDVGDVLVDEEAGLGSRRGQDLGLTSTELSKPTSGRRRRAARPEGNRARTHAVDGAVRCPKTGPRRGPGWHRPVAACASRPGLAD